MNESRYVRLEDRTAFAWCAETYGIPGSAFDDLDLYQRGKSALWAASRNLRLEGLRPVDGVGIPFVRIGRAVWKITSVAAVHFGHLAERNVVEVDADELRVLLRRGTVELTPGDPRLDLPVRGNVIARYRGAPIGVALWRGGRIESGLPKARRLDDPDLPL